jgi:hypothetical protein
MNWTNENLTAAFAFVSIILSGFAIYKSTKSARKTLSNKYFHDIFDSVIITKYPKLLNEINNNSSTRLYDLCTEFVDLTNSLMSDIFFYKFFDNSFYEEVKVILVRIEESALKIMQNSSSNPNIHKEMLEEEFNKLYGILNKYYLNI